MIASRYSHTNIVQLLLDADVNSSANIVCVCVCVCALVLCTWHTAQLTLSTYTFKLWHYNTYLTWTFSCRVFNAKLVWVL